MKGNVIYWPSSLDFTQPNAKLHEVALCAIFDVALQSAAILLLVSYLYSL